jgi:hypothetical protein
MTVGAAHTYPISAKEVVAAAAPGARHSLVHDAGRRLRLTPFLHAQLFA